MNKFLNVLLMTLAIVKLGQAAEATTGPRKPNFEILFVKDIVKYVQSNRGVQLTVFSYDKKEGFTLGEKWDNKLFSLEYNLDGFKDDHFSYSRSYTYPGDVTLDIQHVQLSYKSSTNDGNVYLKAGGIGQNFVSLVVEVGDTDEATLTCTVNVTGDVYDVIN